MSTPWTPLIPCWNSTTSACSPVTPVRFLFVFSWISSTNFAAKMNIEERLVGGMGQRVEGVIFKQLTCQPLLHHGYVWAEMRPLCLPVPFWVILFVGGLSVMPWRAHQVLQRLEEVFMAFPGFVLLYCIWEELLPIFLLQCVFLSRIRLQLIFNPRENMSSQTAFVHDRCPV